MGADKMRVPAGSVVESRPTAMLARWHQHGFPATYPVAIVQDGSLPTQRVLRSTVVRVADAAAAMEIKSPSVIVIGKVVNAIGADSVVPFPEWAHITA